jgi:hypothetical protein
VNNASSEMTRSENKNASLIVNRIGIGNSSREMSKRAIESRRTSFLGVSA